MAESPLTEALPTSLEALFNLDPDDMQEKDIAQIVAALRSQRVDYLKAEAEGKKPPRAKAPKTAVSPEALSDVMKDLGLD